MERALAPRPDVIVMDLQMPRLSGVGAVQALHERWPEARVLIVTSFAQDEHLFEALRAGARGYLLKDAGADELAVAIRTVHEGARWSSRRWRRGCSIGSGNWPRAEAVARGRSLGLLPLDDAHFDEGPHPRPLSHGSAKGG